MRRGAAMTAVWLLAAGLAAGQDQKDPAPAASPDGAVLALKLDALSAQIQTQVRALRERALSGDTGGVEQARQDLEELRDKLAILLPERPKAAPASREDRRRREARALLELSDVRSALTLYSGDHDWQFPHALEDLVPKYLPEIPTLDLPDHGPVTAVRDVPKLKGPKDMLKTLQDSGGWLYIADPDSPLWGSVLIDCTHKNSDGDEWDRL